MALTRKKHTMPKWMRAALTKAKLIGAYNARPAYQRNDYIWWITNAKREETQQKRLTQMLAELKKGGVYMNMTHTPSKKK